MNKRVFIGGAWPYANYNLHIGHLAALLPGDIIARYYRQNNYTVIYVSGSDAHGTPITERARKEKVTPTEIAHKYHEDDKKDFSDMCFMYDNYGATFMDWHKDAVKNMFITIFDNGYFYDKESQNDFCEKCNKFLSDREITGNCPMCATLTKGDQCDACFETFHISELKNKKCLICGTKPTLRPNHELVFLLSKFQGHIRNFFENNKHLWRTNAKNETEKYLTQGLHDRDATRSLNWGIEVPFKGFEDKCIYVWFEAVLGYLSCGYQVAEKMGIDFNEFMKDDGNLISYYIHGKDNIPFHTIILPALIMALDENIQLPKYIVSSNYVNMNSEKMSKSIGNIITIRDLLNDFESDSIRFYFMLNNPEKKDVNFNSEDLIDTHNKFLVGGFGNFVNRNLSFIKKQMNGIVPMGIIDPKIRERTKDVYEVIGNKIANGEMRLAAEEMITYIQEANKFYDSQAPWIQVKEEDRTGFNNTTSTCLYIIANMSNIFSIVIPNGCEKVRKMLQIESNLCWNEIEIKDNLILDECVIIYNRI